MKKLILICNSLKITIQANKKYFLCQYDARCLEFLKKLYIEGYIEKIVVQNNFLKVFIKYNSYSSSILKNIKVLSKPSKHFYLGYKSISKILTLGNFYFLTSKGILTGVECIQFKVGGKFLCSIF